MVKFMIEKENVNYIPGTSVAVRVYNIDRYEPHYHEDCIELLFVLKGDINILSTYDKFHLEKNDFTVINKGDIHYIKGRGENLVLSLYLNLSHFEKQCEYVQYIYFACESFNANSLQEKCSPEVRNLIIDIVLEAAKDDSDPKKIDGFAKRLMDIFINKYDFAHYHNGKEIPNSQLQRYYRIVKLIDTKYGEKLDLNDLAQKEFVGRNYISQFWKNLTNMNLTDYITSVRSERAEKMMLTSNKSINEVSFNCGFSDSKYIYKGFKKWYEKTPSQHKKEYEKYKAEGTSVKEYSEAEILSKFGRTLIYANMDENKASFMKDSEKKENWRQKYELQIGKYSGSKIKQEMIKENHLEAGLKEIYLPLFDRAVVDIDGGNINMDMEFVEMVVKGAKKMSLLLYIEIYFPEHSVDEWESVLEYFVHALNESDAADFLPRCRFVVCFDDFADAVNVRKLMNRISHMVSSKNIRMALRFS